ncbi:peptide ABC transporter substrate-binding protein [Variovorax sp. RB2P76]|uniref:peptide ABC transporter substrate-binding protein n=1 Tax=Variovorax sp. RB2P76 TaxID=3443736 RepID=UPI003F44D116
MLRQLFRRAALALGATACLALAAPLSLAQPAPKAGGTALIALIQEPGSFNRFLTGQTGALLGRMVVEGLFDPDEQGNYLPLLAAQLPTQANGAVSADSLSVRYTLRPGLKWSDGQPLTSADYVFTFEAYRNPASTPAGDAITPAWQQIESVTAVDALNFVVKMKRPNPGYLELFNIVLPKHKFDSPALTQVHAQSRLPLGTGPFVVKEWRTGDAIVLVRNPHYRQAGKPYLDQIVLKIIPNREVAMQGLLRGEVDTLFFPTTGDLPTLIKAQKEGNPIEIAMQGSKSWVEWLWLNNTSNGDPKRPHPVLGDPAVREAMDRAINRQQIIDQVFGGLGQLTGSFLYSGWAAVDIPATPYDPAKASQVLEAAGWKKGADGVRVRNNVRASLRFQTISGDRTRELYQQLIQQNLKDVGIEIKIQNVPSTVLFGGYKDGGLMKRGNFDIAMSRDGYVVDPVVWAGKFTTPQIPSAEHVEGLNFMFYSNAEYDRVVDQAATIVDMAERRKLYTQAARRFAADRPALPLYSSAWGTAWSKRLGGVKSVSWNGIWAQSADWYIAK